MREVSQTDIKGLLQVLEVKLQSLLKTDTVFALCDSACKHSWISGKLAAKLLVRGTATKITVHGIDSEEIVDIQMVQLKLLPEHSGDTEYSTFDVKPLARKHHSVGKDFIGVDGSEKEYLHLESLPKGYGYANVKTCST